MSFVSDQLYSGYLRTNMPKIVTRVEPREIVVHLPCLTDHDREVIEAKRETCGRFDAMVRLLDCLKRRENWPEQFIAALEACEHRIIAAEIRAEYDALRGINNSSPPPTPPAANVVAANVHPAPSAPHLPHPGPTASAPPPGDVPSTVPETQPMQETEKPDPQSSAALAAAPVMEVTAAEPPQAQTEPVVIPPVTPPPSPDSMRGSANPSPPPKQMISHQEPEENLEPESLPGQAVPNETMNLQKEAEENIEIPQATDIQLVPCEVDNPTETATMVEQSTPAQTIVNENTPIINTVNKPQVAEPEPVTVVMEDTTDASANAVEEAALTTTIIETPIVPPAAVEASPGRSASPLTNLDDLILTPEKHPVQETRPTLENKQPVVPVLKNTSEPQNAQVVVPQEIEVPPRPPVDQVNSGAAVSEDEDIFFSKPGVLVSVEPPDQNNTTIRPPSPESEPYSGDSGRIEMSKDVANNHNNPDKEVSESPASSLEEDDVQENVGHVAEGPSILNKEIHSQLMEDSDKLTKEISDAPPIAACTMISDLSSSTDPGESTAPNLNGSENHSIEISIPPTTMISETTSCLNGEDISESPAPSLDMEDIRENIGYVAEDPSVLNLVQAPLHQIGDGESDREFEAISSGVGPIKKVEQEAENSNVQTPLIQSNGETTKEMAPVPPNSTPSTNDNHKPNDPPVDPKQPDSGKTTRSLNTRYIITAAGVGACALLIAWRFKN